jgi:hypothetical protein
MPVGLFTIEFYEEDGRAPVEEWMEKKLTDVEHAALLSALEHVLSHLGHGVCGTEWGKQLGGGLFEFRIRHTADEIARMFGGGSETAKRGEKVVLRVFCHAYGDKIVLLLNGYDKGADPSEKRQQWKIATARKRLIAFEQRQARERKGGRRR